MERKPVDSSYIRSVGYDAERQQLEIEFTRGVIYRYSEVPQSIHDRLMGARSHGRYFYRRIRDRYPYEQVQGDENVAAEVRVDEDTNATTPPDED